jgi:hypothetical protein
MRQKSSPNEPLHSKDTETMTFGCRQTSPDNCTKNSLPDICAFVRKDQMCLSPPATWRRKFKELKNKNNL